MRLHFVAALLFAVVAPFFINAAKAGDSHISSFQNLRRQLGQSAPSTPPEPPALRDPQCELPEAPAESRIVQISTYDGQGISSVAIGSQDVEVTTVAVTVEPGREPLYVVASSFKPVIWRFHGAVGRVRRLILASETVLPGAERDAMPLSGATGVVQDRIFFVRHNGCLHYFTDPASLSAAHAGSFVHHQAGRSPQVQAAHEHVSTFSIPSGALTKSGRPLPSIGRILGFESPNMALAREVALYSPDGLVKINAADVTASRHVEPYIVLPGLAGLQQLVRQSALAQLSDNEFLVQRSFRFPAELTGAHSAIFLLPKGIAMLNGNPGHSCVVSREDVRKVLKGTCP